MPAIGSSWFATNQSRSYPLAGHVSNTANDGRLLPEALICDLRLRFPGVPTDRAYLQTVTNGNTLTIVVAAADGPVASATIASSDSRKWQPVALKPLLPGAAGYVVVGFSSTQGRWDFDSPEPSELCIRAATP